MRFAAFSHSTTSITDDHREIFTHSPTDTTETVTAAADLASASSSTSTNCYSVQRVPKEERRHILEYSLTSHSRSSSQNQNYFLNSTTQDDLSDDILQSTTSLPLHENLNFHRHLHASVHDEHDEDDSSSNSSFAAPVEDIPCGVFSTGNNHESGVILRQPGNYCFGADVCFVTQTNATSQLTNAAMLMPDEEEELMLHEDSIDGPVRIEVEDGMLQVVIEDEDPRTGHANARSSTSVAHNHYPSPPSSSPPSLRRRAGQPFPRTPRAAHRHGFSFEQKYHYASSIASSSPAASTAPVLVIESDEQEILYRDCEQHSNNQNIGLSKFAEEYRKRVLHSRIE